METERVLAIIRGERGEPERAAAGLQELVLRLADDDPDRPMSEILLNLAYWESQVGPTQKSVPSNSVANPDD